MVVLERYRDLPGAEIASATLDAAGIVNSLADTYTIGLVWTYSTALGWIRLCVADADLEMARLLIAPGGEIEWPAVALQEEEHCPICSSADLAVDSGARKTLALALLIYIPLWFWRSRQRCETFGASQVVPLRFRPELVLAWLASALVALGATIAVYLAAGYIIKGRT